MTSGSGHGNRPRPVRLRRVCPRSQPSSRTLRSALSHAVTAELITRNVRALLRLPAGRKQRRRREHRRRQVEHRRPTPDVTVRVAAASVVRWSGADRSKRGGWIAGCSQVAQRDYAGDLVGVIGHHEPSNAVLAHHLGGVVKRRVVADENHFLREDVTQPGGGRVFALGDSAYHDVPIGGDASQYTAGGETTSPMSSSRMAWAASTRFVSSGSWTTVFVIRTATRATTHLLLGPLGLSVNPRSTRR